MKIKTQKVIKNLNPIRKTKKNSSKEFLKSDRARTRDNDLAQMLAKIFQ